jgi:hypothetical protein
MDAIVDVDANRKTYLTAQAKLALRGFATYELADGSYLATKWGLLSKPLPDLKALLDFARQVGAA